MTDNMAHRSNPASHSLRPLRSKSGPADPEPARHRPITTRKQAEAALREKEAHFLSILNSIGDVLFTLDREGRVLEIYGQGSERWGLPKSRYIGRTATELWGGEEGETHEYYHRRVLAGDTVAYDWRIPDPPNTDFQISLSPLRSVDGAIVGMVGMANDISELKRLEKEVLEISDKERQRIGQDLHDGLGQHLAGVAFLTQVLHRDLASRKLPQAKAAAEIANLVNQGIAQTRGISRGLAPVEMEKDLPTALAALTANVRELFRVRCEFTCQHPVPALDQATGTHLYRIVQEAVHNAIAHARPHCIRIGLDRHKDALELVVENDGTDFSSRTVVPRKGLGLRIMAHRARMIGAHYQVRPRRGGGAVVRCTLAGVKTS